MERKLPGLPDRQTLRLVDALPESVEAAFASFKAPTGRRGGYPRPGVKPAVKNSGHPDKGVETTFSGEQKPYISTVIACLNGLMIGKLFGEHGSAEVRPLSGRIPTYFFNTDLIPVSPEQFKTAIGISLVDTVKDFAKYYPNLMPAAKAMFDTAGIPGMQTAIDMAMRFHFQPDRESLFHHFPDGTSVEMPTSNIASERPLNHLGRSVFVGQNENDNGEPYEDWCSGVTTARTIIRESLKVIKQSRISEGVPSDNNPIYNAWFEREIKKVFEPGS